MARPFDFSQSAKDGARLRQNGKCATCGSKEISLNDLVEHAHHVIPNQSGESGNSTHDWLRSVDNCVIVCDLCHERVHADGKTRTGAVAPPDYFPFSHGRSGSRLHKSWAAKLNGLANQLFGGRSARGNARVRGAVVIPIGAGREGADHFKLTAAQMAATADALALFQGWAETLNMWAAANQSLAMLREREFEIMELRQKYPDYPVYVVMTWQKEGMNYEVYPPDIYWGGNSPGSNPVGFQAASGMHGYVLTIDAVKRNDKKKEEPKTTVRDHYAVVYGSVRSDRSDGGQASKALRQLNGLAMADILAVLKKIRQVDPDAFDKLEQALYWAFANVAVSRLEAAFQAIRMSENNGDSFAPYKASCKQFTLLPDDQQKAIEQFMSGKAKEVEDGPSPAGQWNVRVSKWLWIYTFDAKGNVSWKDPYNGMGGTGRYRLEDGKLKIAWYTSKTTDSWDLPLSTSRQTGSVLLGGSERHALNASRSGK